MASNDPLIGKQIGNYRILAKINSGSFGNVYQGKHVIFEDDPVVAIKVLDTALHSAQEHTEFIKEAQVLKKLNHPHILRIFDAGFQDGVPFLVTEYAARGSLRDRLKQSNGRPLPLDEASNILTQIGQALHYAHERHIIHRDLKPENILFNQGGDALLADFGIAVLLASTRTGLVGISGTPPYMAPEQFEGLASARSDQYSLGCIAYELFTGQRLFTIPTPTLEAYWYHHAKVEPLPPMSYYSYLPKHIEQAILVALAKDRSHRHQDVSTFCKGLLKSKEAWLEEGNTLSNLNRYNEALTTYEQAIQLDPNFADAYNKEIALSDLKDYQDALAALEQAIRRETNSTAYYGSDSYYLRVLKRHQDALATLEQAIRLDPNDAVAYYGKGNALFDLKRHQEALTAYEQSIALDPNFAAAYYEKGCALSHFGRSEEALVAYDQAIGLNPNNIDYYNSKGWELKYLERYDEALTAYEQAIALDFDYEPAWYGISSIQRKKMDW